jgi:hypothetical protein
LNTTVNHQQNYLFHMPLQLLLMFYEKEKKHFEQCEWHAFCSLCHFGRDLLSKEAMFWCITKVFLLAKDERIGNESVNFACTKLKSNSPTLYQCGGHACLRLHLLFGCGLLSKEDAKSYVWLFKSIFLCFFF